MGDNYYVLRAISYYFFCKHYFKMCGIFIPYTCQETSANFYLLFITNPLPGNFYVYLQY